MNKDNYLWVIEEYYDGEWHPTTMVAWARNSARELKGRCGDYCYRIRKYIRES